MRAGVRLLSSVTCLLLCLTPGVEAVGSGGLHRGPMWERLLLPWPSPDTTEVEGVPVEFASHSPFALADVGTGPEDDPPTVARGLLFLPPTVAPGRQVPAVVMLHGAAGILPTREVTYGRQLAAMGVAALAVDAFGARREMASGFLDRLMHITEASMLADAYAARSYLAGRPEIDPDRIVLVGFSYGGMATLYAASAQVARTFAPGGGRFAAHVAFYAPCIVRFEDRRSTGAPVLMLYGTADAIVDPARCRETADWLTAGGSSVTMIGYPGALHQWDGRAPGPRRIGWNLAPCRFQVAADGSVTDATTGLPMSGPFLRKLILYFCSDSDGYLIGRDDVVRTQSNQDFGAFLTEVFDRP